jgi:YD repeat-containing protein
MDEIRDRFGRVVVYLEEREGRTFVYDPERRLLGWTDWRATYDPSGKQVLGTPSPAFLLARRR